MRLFIALAAMLAFLGSVPLAPGATAGFLQANHFVYEAAAGEMNDVQASYDGAVITIRDAGATITPGTGCSSVDAHEVSCAEQPYFELEVSLGDLADTFTVLNGGNGEVWHVNGGPGGDTIADCGYCIAFLHGDAGDDSLTQGDSGTPGTTQGYLYGDEGDDTLTGGEGSDTLDEGAGDDALGSATPTTSGQVDRLIPGPGDDTVAGTGTGASADCVSYIDSTAAITADLAAGVATGEGTDTLIGVECIYGSSYGDHLAGDSKSNVLADDRGEDVLVGRGGADFLYGGSGADRLFGGAGPDWLQGYWGPDYLAGGPGRDTLWGGLGVDRLFGGAGPDSLRGYWGPDYLAGGPGRDTLWGGRGNDWLAAKDGVRDIVNGSYGFDIARVDLGLDRVRRVEKIYG